MSTTIIYHDDRAQRCLWCREEENKSTKHNLATTEDNQHCGCVPGEDTDQQRCIRIYHECEGGIEKFVSRITVWHHKAFPVMINSDLEGRIFFYPILTRIVDFFLAHHQITHFVF